MDEKIQDFAQSSSISKDFFYTFLGKYLGGGSGRNVFELKTDPTLVVKIENTSYSFQNVIENRVWEEVHWTKYKKYFAPVTYISPCGIILIQKKVEPAYKKDLPKKIPAFLNDIKAENFGMLDGKFVCFDYGTYIITGNLSNKMKKAEWR